MLLHRRPLVNLLERFVDTFRRQIAMRLPSRTSRRRPLLAAVGMDRNTRGLGGSVLQNSEMNTLPSLARQKRAILPNNWRLGERARLRLRLA